MPTKSRLPKKYRAPLKSRKAITEYLMDYRGGCKKACRESRNYGHGERSLFCYNVKVYGADFDFDTLLKAAGVDLEVPTDTTQESYIAQARGIYEAMEETDSFLENLWDAAVEDARRNIDDGDTYRCLCSGPDIDVEWAFLGRSGGWLCLLRFNDLNFTDPNMTDEDWEKVFLGTANEEDGYPVVDFPTLRLLYQFLVQCDEDFRAEGVNGAVEFAAADHFFRHMVPSRLEKMKEIMPDTTDRLQDFMIWLGEVDRKLFGRGGESVFDYTDAPWGDWFREGLTVKQAEARFNEEE